MDERRLFLAVALSFLVLTVFSLLWQPAPRPALPPTPGASATPTPERALPVQPTPAAPEHAVQPAVADTQERRIEVETPYALLAFTNRGARLLSWRLPDYPDNRGRPEETVALVPRVSGQSEQEPWRPLDIETGDNQVDRLLRTEALFRASAESIAVKGRENASLVFEWAAGDLVARKELRFTGSGRLVDVSVSVRRQGREIAKRLLWGPGLGVPTAEERSVRGFQPAEAVALMGGSVERVPAKKLRDNRKVFSGARWVGVENRYFAALFVSPDGAPVQAEASAQDVPTGKPGELEARSTAALDLGLSQGPVSLYVGPKDFFVLSKAGHDLKAVVPVGEWIGPIVVPLMGLLRWVHARIGNYGWSIVLITLVINIVMAPLRHFGIVNGMKMARMAPEMRVVQDRYKKLPLMERQTAMQGEMATLYKRHGVSMGAQMTVGCLPLVLTMPFFIAFYRVLDISIELRGAPFLWIPDLSNKDPLFLSPILMAVSMFAMQKMTPSGADPTQQRMMLLMPLVFVSFLFWAPAGLNIYWLASNVCAMAQQGATMAILGSKHRTVTSKAKRR
jgi:YidC/Oxa1 family membrane protein insertase